MFCYDFTEISSFSNIVLISVSHLSAVLIQVYLCSVSGLCSPAVSPTEKWGVWRKCDEEEWMIEMVRKREDTPDSLKALGQSHSHDHNNNRQATKLPHRPKYSFIGFSNHVLTLSPLQKQTWSCDKWITNWLPSLDVVTFKKANKVKRTGVKSVAEFVL